MPTQILEVRFEADTPDDAMQEVVESLQVHGLDVRPIREEFAVPRARDRGIPQ